MEDYEYNFSSRMNVICEIQAAIRELNEQFHSSSKLRRETGDKAATMRIVRKIRITGHRTNSERGDKGVLHFNVLGILRFARLVLTGI